MCVMNKRECQNGSEFHTEGDSNAETTEDCADPMNRQQTGVGGA